MDFFFENHSRTNLCLLIFNFLSCIPLIFSLSTISISETSNHTLICAIMQSSTNPQPYLNCTSFPPGIQIPTNSFNTSLSGIVGGDGFLCALGSPSSIMVCWRFSANGSNMIFKRIYNGPDLYELDAGNSHICGLVNDTNRLECWQWKEFNPTNQSFSSHIAVGENFVCGLLETRKVKCLGDGARVVGVEHLNGNYSVVAAGFNHACAISSYGSLDCWGEMGGEKPQGDQFTSLALGRSRSCALRYNQTVVCWGENNFRLPDRLQGIYFIAIEAKRNVFCGVLSSNYSLYCWGNENFDSNFMVFENVQPGPCRSKCPCGILPGSGYFCDQEFICQPCPTTPPAVNPPLPPAPAPAPAPAPQKSKSSRWNRKMVAFLVVGCVGSLSLVMVICFLVFRYGKCRGCRIHDSGRLDETGMNAPQANQSAPLPVLEKRLSQLTSMGTNGSHLEEFPLQVLLQATDNFSNERKIGTGSFGSVYHAMLEDGRDVAIKRAEVSNTSSYAGTKRGQQDKDSAFLNELEFLSRLNHKNLVRLIGFCEDINELVLVYEYMANGSLHDHLHKIQSSHLMSWTTRLKVALDTARGIEYLHRYAVPQIIHRDIKSSNILLDATWTAKVSDFGLSLMGPADNEEHLSLGAAGTVGYLDPEYYRLQQLTTKSDVYSYGVVLLELLSGNKAIHRNENGVPRNVVDFVVPYIVQDEIHRILDPNVPPPTPFEIEAVAYVGYLAADCVSLEGRNRPGMTEIVNSLERALAACLTNPEHQRSKSRSSSIE